MYDLSISLKYNEPLALQKDYIYDFLGIDVEPIFGNCLPNKNIFVFRTIKYGNAANNVLIDLIDYSNLNAFDVTLHGDFNIHMLKSKKFLEDKEIRITDNIFLEVIENASNYEFYAILKDQKYNSTYGTLKEIQKNIQFPVIKYLLFTEYKEKPANMNKVQLAPIFDLQKELIWHNNRYWNFNNLSQLDVDNLVDHKLPPSTPWKEVKTIINRERENWEKKRDEKFNQFLDDKYKSQKYIPIER